MLPAFPPGSPRQSDSSTGARPPSRRAFLGAALGAAAALPASAARSFAAQAPAPPQVAPNPVRDWSQPGPMRYPDPDIVTIDPRFRKYALFNTPIQRLYTGTLWAEGPAWNGVGRYLVWSDIPNNVQMRWLDDDGHVSVFRRPSDNSNGNTFDHQGRQVSCQHGGRRVVRYEPNGTMTVVADRFEGKRLNSPNDLVVHPDGGIWFTDPVYGIGGLYEGMPAAPELKPAVYRIDPNDGSIVKVADEVGQPNGICFSPDYSKLYVADTGNRETKVWTVQGATLAAGQTFARIDVPGIGALAADGIRCDTDGNVWAATRVGVIVMAPDGVVIGLIRLPEHCGNLCFGGAKRNRLFVAASQSLYAVYVGAQGAHMA